MADFIFTTLHRAVPADEPPDAASSRTALRDQPDVRLVSFTVDPERDTPAVLAEYAKRYQADPARWFFLTGDEARLHSLGRDAFKLHNVDGTLVHSTRFVLVDRQSRIRGYYGTEDEDPVARLLADISAAAGREIVISARDLPTLNAVLNATAAVLLVWGYTLIRRQAQSGASQGDARRLHRVLPVPGFLPCVSLPGGLGAFPEDRRHPHALPEHPGDPHRAGGGGAAAGHRDAQPRP